MAVLGALTDQLGKCFEELMKELRAIRVELAGLRSVLEERNHHAALRPVPKKTASARGK